MPAPAILIPQTWGQTVARTDRAIVNGRPAWWKLGILPPNGYGIRAGLQAHWRLDGDGVDSSAYGRTLTTLQNIAWGTGVSNQCLSFADRAAIRCAYGAAIDASAWPGFTISFWANKTADAGANYPRIISFGRFNVDGVELFIQPGATQNRLIAAFNRAGGTENVATPGDVLSALINHYAITFDLASRAVVIYVNAVAVMGATLVNVPVMPNRALCVGNNSGSPAAATTWIGLGDEAKIWNRVLPLGEIKQDYEAPDGYIDYASLLDNNQLQVSARGSVFKPSEASQVAFGLRNDKQTFMEGDLANAPMKLWHAVQNETDLMDYGDCEHATQGPMLLGDTGDTDTVTAQLHRWAGDAYRGVSCYRYTKLSALGAPSHRYINNTAVLSMRGCVPGGRLRIRFRIKIETAEIANWNGQDFRLYFQEYSAGAWVWTCNAIYVGTASENQWRNVSAEVTLGTATIYIGAGLYTAGAGIPAGASLLVDDLKYSCSSPYDTAVPVRQWTQLFTGFISPEGCQRTVGNITDDKVTLQAFDAIKKRGMNRRCKNQAVTFFEICDTGAAWASLVHLLAGQMGFVAAMMDVDNIVDVKDYIGFNRTQFIWPLLQNLAQQHGALLAIRWDGKLRLKVWTAADWAAAVPEFTFDSTNVRKGWRGQDSDVWCNVARTEFSKYQILPAGSIIYKDYKDWSDELGRNTTVLHAGEYWPIAAEAQGVAQLEYGYGQEKYPIAIDVIAPTIGLLGSGCDIEASGVITLISFNGSTADTVQNVDSSEIILRNNTAGDVTIYKRELRGTPLREIQKVKVETVTATDGTTPAPEDIVEQTIPGDFATDSDQAKVTCLRWVDFGHLPRKYHDFPAEFTAHLQVGAIARFNPDATTDVIGVIVGYQHKTVGPWGVPSMTQVQMVERVDFSAVGSGKVFALAHARPPGSMDPAHPTHLVVGAPGSTGRFDYVAPGAADQTCINAAIEAVWANSGAVGGTVELIGTFYTTGIISITHSNITLNLDQAQIIKNFNGDAVQVLGTAIARLTGVKIIGGTIARDPGDVDAFNSALILQYADKAIIRDLLILDPTHSGIGASDCEDILIDRCVVLDWNHAEQANVDAIHCTTGVTGTIRDCVIDGLLTAHDPAGTMVGIRANSRMSILHNSIKRVRSTTNVIGIYSNEANADVSLNSVWDFESTTVSYGIVINGGGCTVKGNTVAQMKKSGGGDSFGIYIQSGTSSHVSQNYCVNNGLDLALLNANENNFHDDGIDTIFS